jgi:hypothetical protein
MRIAITGSSGLAKTIKDVFEATPHAGKTFTVKSLRIEDITANDTKCWIFDKENKNHIDVLINFAHQDFDQVKVLDIVHRAWCNDSTKYIINISSRASQPNISKGYMYSAQKNALNHLANNLTYNSNRKYKMTTVNLGLLNHELPSIQHQEVAFLLYKLVTIYPHLEITDLTLQAHANYLEVQDDKSTLQDVDKMVQSLYPQNGM